MSGNGPKAPRLSRSRRIPFADASCDCGTFDVGFRELVRPEFPEPEYRLRFRESEHPIWYAEEKIDPNQLRPVLGVDFGCRTSVVYVPPDLAGNPRLVALVPLGSVAATTRQNLQPHGAVADRRRPDPWASTCWLTPRIGNCRKLAPTLVPLRPAANESRRPHLCRHA